MNLDRNDIDIEEILYRYFRDELSVAERAEVDVWKSISPENEAMFDELRLLYLDLKGLSYYSTLEIENAARSWEVFKRDNKIKSSKPAGYLRYAASVAIIFATAIGIFLVQKNPSEVTLAASTAVQEFQLGDGSQVRLNEGAILKYAEPFQNNERRVILTGEGYFDIAKNPDKAFVVEIGEAEVRVLGTEFYINRPSDQKFDVLVDEGKVLVSLNEKHEIVEAGNMLSIDLMTDSLSFSTIDQHGADTFWKNRILIFDLTAIDEVVATVNKAYNSNVILKGSTEGCSLTVTFDNESLENVLKVISSTLNYQLVEDQGSITLEANGCE